MESGRLPEELFTVYLREEAQQLGNRSWRGETFTVYLSNYDYVNLFSSSSKIPRTPHPSPERV